MLDKNKLIKILSSDKICIENYKKLNKSYELKDYLLGKSREFNKNGGKIFLKKIIIKEQNETKFNFNFLKNMKKVKVNSIKSVIYL